MTRFNNIAPRIMYSFLSDLSNVAFNDMIVVNVPLPAIKGNAIGTIVPDGADLSGLKNSMPNTISKPRMNITIEPATANDGISTPRIFKNGLPTKKNKIINAPEINVTFHALMLPIFSFIEISIGTEPTTSITAKSVNVSVRNSWKLNCIRLVSANVAI